MTYTIHNSKGELIGKASETQVIFYVPVPDIEEYDALIRNEIDRRKKVIDMNGYLDFDFSWLSLGWLTIKPQQLQLEMFQ